jgi:transposase-like protein
MESPKTLLEAVQYFSDAENCRKFMIAVRWSDGIVKCPHCGSEKVTYLENAKVYRCYGDHKKQKFSLKVGTVFEDSPIGLEKWLPAAWLLSNCKNGISSYELARDLGVTQKSAWFMLHRIRTAMKDMNRPSKIGGPESGPVEVDEAFVGGKVGNMHKGRVKAMRAQMPADRADGYEAPRYDNKRETLQREILSNVKYGSKVYTDSAVGYDLLRRRYVHETVNHAETYVNGQVHTNSLENFWSLMKRNLSGTYVAVEPFHLDRYLDEQLFRFNNRINTSDEQRFRKVVGQLAGRRLTYADLTGKEAGAEIF